MTRLFLLIPFMFLVMLLIGFIVSIPLGPISLLCIRKTIEHGVLAGLTVGMGAALADALYALGATLGFSALSPFLVQHQTTFRIVFGLLLIGLGVNELQRGHPMHRVSTVSFSHWLMVKSFFLTLANPLTVLSFAGIFSVLGFLRLSYSQLCLMMTGVFCGSMLWWLFLSYTAKRVSPVYMKILFGSSCFLLIGFGLWILIYA